MKKRIIYCIASIVLAIFLSSSAFASYAMEEGTEDRETHLKMEVVPSKPEGSVIEKEEVTEPEEEAFPIPKLPVIREEEIVEREIEAPKTAGYKLGADDVIQVSVLRHPEFSGQLVIEPNGYISLPYLDPIKAEGLTKYQLKDKLIMILSAFVEKPNIDVRIVEYNSQFIYVVGAVAKPGKYSTQGKKMTVRDAITAAGMPIRGASLRYAYVFSPDPTKPKKAVRLYDLLYRGKNKHDLELEPGSIVYVRSTVISKLGFFLDQLLNPIQRATAIKYIEEAY